MESFISHPQKRKTSDNLLVITRLSRAENETRTRDPNLGKVVLYQLSYFRSMFRTCGSYFPIASANIELISRFCKF